MIALLMLIMCCSIFFCLVSSGGAAFSRKPLRDQENWPYLDPETILWGEEDWGRFKDCLDYLEEEEEGDKEELRNIYINDLNKNGIYISRNPSNRELCQKTLEYLKKNPLSSQ